MIDKEKLEEVLIRNWASFLDSKKLMVRVLQDANSTADTFNIVMKDVGPKKMVQISVSRFQLTTDGFVVWVEFVIPRERETYIGTAEYVLKHSGDLDLRQLIGTRFTHEGRSNTRAAGARTNSKPS